LLAGKRCGILWNDRPSGIFHGNQEKRDGPIVFSNPTSGQPLPKGSQGIGHIFNQ
jgi:hypothetical protein